MRFERQSGDLAVRVALERSPIVLVVAPLSGHHATLLRDTVRTLLSDHDVYITDWIDARLEPLRSPWTTTVEGDLDDAEAHRRFYDEYKAVIDLPVSGELSRRPDGTWGAVHFVMFSKQLMTLRHAHGARSGSFGVWLVGSGIGAGLVYLFDPSQGRRRRTLIGDKLDHYRHRSSRLLGKAWRDLSNRARGLGAEARRHLACAEVDDDTLVARARSKLGRYASHPHALAIQAAQGKLTLTGPILEEDVSPLLHAIEHIPGVTGVDDQLERHSSAENVPALQGGRARGGDPAEILQRSWTPSLRVGAGAAGIALVASGLRRGLVAAVALPIGGALLLRAMLDRPLPALLGLGTLEDGFELRKSLTLHVPIERAFAWLTAFEQYPQFMTHVKHVERVADSHYRCTIRGKAGVELQFESELLELVPEQHFTLAHAGDRRGEHFARVRFESAGDATRLHIEARYLPRLGAIGLGLTRLLAAHPKHLLDADLAILKTLLEQGKARVDGRQITVDELGQLPAQASQPSAPS